MTTRVDEIDRAALVDMAQGFFRGKLLCAAVRLGVADALGDDEKGLDEIARATASDPASLHRLLRALASIGVVREVAPARFALTPFGRPLRKAAADTVWASIVFWDLLADFWTYLPECVRHGGDAGAAGAMARDGVTSRWSKERDATAIFHAVFAEPGPADMAPFAAAGDFSRCRVVADLGGAGGSLLVAILVAHPNARGILVDREEALIGAAARLTEAGLAHRCELVAGDLLEAAPRGADAYVMKSVLHGYDDERAGCILRNCRTAMAPDSRLLIMETVLPAIVNRPDPLVEKMTMGDLNMLTATGGRERSEEEWRRLLGSGGFEVRGIASVSGSPACIIDAAPRG